MFKIIIMYGVEKINIKYPSTHRQSFCSTPLTYGSWHEWPLRWSRNPVLLEMEAFRRPRPDSPNPKILPNTHTHRHHFQVHKSKWPLLPGSNQGSSPRFPCWHSSLCVIRDDRNDGQTDKNGKWCRQPVSLPKTSFLRLLCITYLEAYAKKGHSR